MRAIVKNMASYHVNVTYHEFTHTPVVAVIHHLVGDVIQRTGRRTLLGYFAIVLMFQCSNYYNVLPSMSETKLYMWIEFSDVSSLVWAWPKFKS